MLKKNIFSKDFPFFMALPAVMWQILFFYIPVALIILFSITSSVTGHSLFTLAHYQYLFSSIYFHIIFRSLILAFFTAFLCMLFAYPLAYFLAVRVTHYKNLFLFFLILPFFTSLMVQVYSWFFILEHDGLINTVLLKMGLINHPLHLLNTTLAIYIVMIYCYIPFMIMPVYASLEKLDRRLLEAAADMGASQWQTFINVTLPLSLPGIKTGFFLVFVPSFGEFIVPTLLGGGKQFFVGSLITQFFLGARNPHLGSAFTVISSIFLMMAVAILYWFFNRHLYRLQKKV